MCLCCYSNPEDGSSDDPKSKLLSPDPPVKSQAENKKSKSSKKEKKVKKEEKSNKEFQKKSSTSQDSNVVSNAVSNAVSDVEEKAAEPIQETDKGLFPPEWNSKAAKFAANTFVGMGLAKRDETLKKTDTKAAELNEDTRNFRSLSRRLKDKQAEKLKNSKLPW